MRGADEPGIVHRRDDHPERGGHSTAKERKRAALELVPLPPQTQRKCNVAGPNRKWTNSAPSEQMRYGVPVIFSAAKTIVTAISTRLAIGLCFTRV